MAFDAVLFDLDGTLVDTLADIADAMNRALASRGLPTYPLDVYRRFVGGGVGELVAHAVADPAERAPVIAAFRARYGERLVVASAPYPGVVALVDALRVAGVAIAVVSNKPDRWTHQVVDALLPGRFEVVIGQDDARPRKPDPAMALAAAEALHAAPRRCAYVGDTGIDVATARAAGMVPIGVAWGFRPEELAGAAHVLDRPDALLRIAQVPEMTER